MDIGVVRNEIDEIDGELVKLFERRMNASIKIADYKKKNNLPVLSKEREREVIGRVTDMCDERLINYTKVLYTTLFAVSRSYQSVYLGESSALKEDVEDSINKYNVLFPEKAIVACQGMEGAYSQQACDRIFKTPNILYFNTFDGVFSAVEQGMCEYGVLPIENSSAGSVTQVYDLMEKHKFHIAKGMRQKIDHALMGIKGTDFSKIKEIISHPQGIMQCSQFIEKHPEIKVTTCENTALAAKIVAESNRNDFAAIASKSCASIYGLNILNDEISNTNNNYTRFIVISRNLEIYPGANKISISLSLKHQPGVLYTLLSNIAALDVNLTKLESRPVVGSDFEFRFHLDLEASLTSPNVMQLLCDIQNNSENFAFHGNYLESY